MEQELPLNSRRSTTANNAQNNATNLNGLTATPHANPSNIFTQ